MNSDAKTQILKDYFGYDHFREGQEQLIDSILCGHDVVGVMPTGAGKSVCFQIPALLLDGLTLVISPLISLMKDQVSSLIQSDIPAAFINSSLDATAYRQVIDNARKGAYKIIYIAPERLETDSFTALANAVNISMVTIDEAHCISQWGQDFRPSYLKIIDFIDHLPYRPVISAFTATATEYVRLDIIKLLRLKDPDVLITGFDRQNLYFEVQKPADKTETLLRFVNDRADKSGIIYCSTRKMVEEVCAVLCARGYPATYYHAGLSDNQRKKHQEAFIFDEKPIMVATNAFGMGIDKSNVNFVVHYNMPKDIESYYQEAGRAGRDGEPADCLLLYSGQDVRLHQYFIENSDDCTNEALKVMARKRLKEMTFYCHTTGCLRAYILAYFDEDAPRFCDHCGNCLKNFETVDITVDAQKILSCIKRTNERFGQKVVIDTLRGSKNKRILQLGFDKLSTYNIMADSSENRIRDIIHELTLRGCIHITDDEYPIMQLTEKAAGILFHGEHLEMQLVKESEPKPKKVKPSAKNTPITENPELFERLRTLRTKIATEQHVPAYIVFSNATLADMSAKAPTTTEAFLDVSGVGNAKLEKYGDAFLGEINSFLKSDPA
ncbi:MAG: DNA helicase RecQ [Eubacterium sp.]